jgi:hypothetical protein
LLPTVRTEDCVFLRSVLFGEGMGGDVGVSLGVDVFRESQANGLVMLLFVIAGVGVGEI